MPQILRSLQISQLDLASILMYSTDVLLQGATVLGDVSNEL
jgi:hypothetical protein